MTTPIYSLPGSGDYRNDLAEALARIKPVKKVRKATTAPLDKDCKARYLQAHEQWFKRTYPAGYANGHYTLPVIPKIRTSNGLTKAIIQFITWNNYRATRISSAGRLIEGEEKQASGAVIMVKKYIPGPTRKGSADISATIKGRSVMFEVKINSDRPSKDQLKEQEREQMAGGLYFFTKTFEQFIEQYDSVLQLKNII